MDVRCRSQIKAVITTNDPLLLQMARITLKRGREPEGERGSTVVYFPQQQEKEKRKYQLI